MSDLRKRFREIEATSIRLQADVTTLKATNAILLQQQANIAKVLQTIIHKIEEGPQDPVTGPNSG